MGRLNHKRGRPSNYRKKLKHNPYWEKVKRKVRIRDNFQCVLCPNKTRLETHHTTYTVSGESILGKEMEHLECLVTVCESCHSNIHKNPNHELNPRNFSS